MVSWAEDVDTTLEAGPVDAEPPEDDSQVDTKVDLAPRVFTFGTLNPGGATVVRFGEGGREVLVAMACSIEVILK